MKKKMNFLTRKLYFSLLILFLFSGCHNLFNGDDSEPANEYLVSHKLEASYLKVFVEEGFNRLANAFPDMSFFQDRVDYGITVYKITYNTEFQGEKKVASGLVCFPMGEGPFPVISYQNGTNTLHRNAPSENPTDSLYLMLEFVASTGFVISIPDYLGFGASDDMFHPYMHKESTVQTVLDMLRAVDELAGELEINVNNDLYITGYSQGGWATMQVQKSIEENHSSEFYLQASACGAGPYDLSYINEYILDRSTYPMPYFTGYIYNSYMNLDAASVPVDSIFREPYATRIPNLYDGTMTGAEINDELTTSVSELFTQNYRENYQTGSLFEPLRTMLGENSIHGWATTTPTQIIHGTADQLVPWQVSENIYEEFQSKGVGNRVTLTSLEGLGHSSAIIPAGLASISWFIELTE